MDDDDDDATTARSRVRDGQDKRTRQTTREWEVIRKFANGAGNGGGNEGRKRERKEKGIRYLCIISSFVGSSTHRVKVEVEFERRIKSSGGASDQIMIFFSPAPAAQAPRQHDPTPCARAPTGPKLPRPSFHHQPRASPRNSTRSSASPQASPTQRAG